MVIGAVNVGSTMVSIATVDRFGRKMLFLVGGIQVRSAEHSTEPLAESSYMPTAAHAR